MMMMPTVKEQHRIWTTVDHHHGTQADDQKLELGVTRILKIKTCDKASSHLHGQVKFTTVGHQMA